MSAFTDREAKGPVVGWRWASALRALHRHGLAYEDQSEGVRSALAAAAAYPEVLPSHPSPGESAGFDAEVELLADLFMDMRLDGPSEDGRTYQQTARHYAAIMIARLGAES